MSKIVEPEFYPQIVLKVPSSHLHKKESVSSKKREMDGRTDRQTLRS